MMWIPREAEQTLQHLAAQRPAVIVTGVRQAGKTSLLRQVFPNYAYVSLDLPVLAEEAEENGSAFLDRYQPPVIIDEVQYAPGLLRYLKNRIDSRRSENGQFLLTGSQKFPLMQGVTESLAGRVSLLELHPLSLKELEAFYRQPTEREQLLDLMLRGGYPELHAGGLDPDRFFSDYVATYLERDVRQIVQVRNLRDFDRFLRLAASRTGQLYSLTSFAGELGVSPNTVKSWFSVLEASNVVLFLEPYYRNLGKRIVKSPKLYFLDTGLACFLSGIRTREALETSSMLGPLFETLVLGQMVRASANRGKSSSIYFYRDHHGHEVDFLMPAGEKLKLFECKWSESVAPQAKDFEAIARAAGRENIISRSVITPHHGRRTLDRGGLEVRGCVDFQDL